MNTLRILRLLRTDYKDTKDEILDTLGLEDHDLDVIMDELAAEAYDAGQLEECGCCGASHRPDFHGDCRVDSERF